MNCFDFDLIDKFGNVAGDKSSINSLGKINTGTTFNQFFQERFSISASQ